MDANLKKSKSQKTYESQYQDPNYENLVKLFNENVAMFQTVITPSKMALGIKVGGVLISSGSPLTDGHWNFPISTFGAWENGV